MQTGHPSTPALASAAAVLAAGVVVLAFHDAGPQARHMTVHIFAMNVVAPVLAALVAARHRSRDMRARWLWIAALGQTAALWAAHLPAVQSAAMARPLLQAAMHLLLAATAVGFWLAVLAASAAHPWHAVAALALSAKLFCLLAALLVFAPRTLHGQRQRLEQRLVVHLDRTLTPLPCLQSAACDRSAAPIRHPSARARR